MVALPSSLSIAVIGAGAGGLTAARSFLKRGVKNLTIFESSSHIGGVWKYSQDPTRPMYRNLQTNLPKEIMGFREYPFVNVSGADSNDDSYVTHEQVFDYLVDYTDHFVFERGNGSDDGNKLAVSDVSTVIFCTGFLMDFPFLDSSDFGEIVFKERRRMSPLYKQLFYARDPRISFVGIPHSVVPFPFMEGQSECIAETIFSDLLPDLEGRIKSAKVDFESGGSRGGRVEDTHYLGSAQFDYLRDIAVLSSTHSDKNEKFLLAQEAIYEDAHQSRMSCVVGNDSYRKDRYLRDHETHLWKKC